MSARASATAAFLWITAVGTLRVQMRCSRTVADLLSGEHVPVRAIQLARALLQLPRLRAVRHTGPQRCQRKSCECCCLRYNI